MLNIECTQVRFPEIQLAARDGHKLRGYFGNVFREHSTLLHNHFETGKLRYAYPLVQYKILAGVPTLIGLGEGAPLLAGLFLQMREIDIDGRVYPVQNKNIIGTSPQVGMSTELREYSFATYGLALNQQNYAQYRNLSETARCQKLASILTGNILSFFRGIGLEVQERILASPRVATHTTQFKDKTMLAFEGGFTANVLLPDYIGLGKSVARGFGAVQAV